MKIKLTVENTILLISDIQVDFCSPDGITAKLKRDISPITEMLPHLKRFYKRLKKDGMNVVFTQFVARKDISPKNVKINEDRNERYRLCLLNSKGAEIYFLSPQKGDSVVQKRYFDAFAETNLLDILEDKKIKNILITGVRSELGIDATAKRAVSEGYNVILIHDLINTYSENKELHDQFIKVFNRYYGYMLESREVFDLLD